MRSSTIVRVSAGVLLSTSLVFIGGAAVGAAYLDSRIVGSLGVGTMMLFGVNFFRTVMPRGFERSERIERQAEIARTAFRRMPRTIFVCLVVAAVVGLVAATWGMSKAVTPLVMPDGNLAIKDSKGVRLASREEYYAALQHAGLFASGILSLLGCCNVGLSYSWPEK